MDMDISKMKLFSHDTFVFSQNIQAFADFS